jgi:hypothetical protein
MVIQNPPTHVGGYGARCFFGRHPVRKRNPFYPVHPVKKILSSKAVATSGLDGDGTNYKRPALRAVSAHRGGSVRKPLICRVGLMQVVDFHNISTYFHMLPAASMAGSAQVPKGSETAYATR